MPESKSIQGELTTRFDLLSFTDSLINDLEQLRAGQISVRDAMARAEIAKQVLRSAGLVVSARKYLSDAAKPANGNKA
ncbi:MAG: hypothetical protein KGL63_04975 [Betaproteobacteria bacterium]|nr:hypothetical protein [Betaproteobacteria bacterium]